MNTENRTSRKPLLGRLSGWPLLLMLVGFAWLATRPGQEVAAVHCGVDKDPADVDVVMLSAQWCTYCRRARRLLVQESVNYCEHDIERSETGRELYRESSVKVIPIIHIGQDTLVGYSKNEILQTLVSHELYPLEKL